MYIPAWGLVLAVVLFIYLIAMDVHLHRRVKRLEHTVRHLEGLKEGEVIKYEPEDVT